MDRLLAVQLRNATPFQHDTGIVVGIIFMPAALADKPVTMDAVVRMNMPTMGAFLRTVMGSNP
jgi:hypothetical protein